MRILNKLHIFKNKTELSSEDIIWGYELFLNRQPENLDIIKKHIKSCKNIKSFIKILIESNEYLIKKKNNKITNPINEYRESDQIGAHESQSSFKDDNQIDRDFSLESGERQTGKNLNEIRYDHLARYELACKIIAEYYGDSTPKLILDVFCGNGYGTNILGKKFDNSLCVGIDGSVEAIQIANKYYSLDNTIFSSKLAPISLGRESVDVAVCFESIEHIEDDKNFLKSILNSIKNHGIAIISVPNESVNSLKINPHKFHFRHYTYIDFADLIPSDYSIKYFYGQNVYQFDENGINKYILLDKDDMNPQLGLNGQVGIYVIGKKTNKKINNQASQIDRLQSSVLKKALPENLKKKKVIVMSDPFRCSELGCISVGMNRAWIKSLVSSSLMGCNFEIDQFAPISEGGEFNVVSYIINKGLSPSQSGWASASEMSVTTEDEKYFEPLLNSACVVGFGLPLSICDLLNRNKIPFLDIEIDPIRFCQDLFLKVRTNTFYIAPILKLLSVPDSLCYANAALMKAYWARRDQSILNNNDNFTLFVGQCRLDLSIVSCGRVMEPADYINDIKKEIPIGQKLLVKPHPLEPDSSHLSVILKEFPGAEISTKNIYHLLSDSALTNVISLSSSVLQECSFFGIHSLRLIDIQLAVNKYKSNNIFSNEYRVYSKMLDSRILELLITSLLNTDCYLDIYQISNVDNIDLRSHLGCSWGFVKN